METALAEKKRQYVARGEGTILFRWLAGDPTAGPVPDEVLLEGQPGSGKTRLVFEFLKAAASRYPTAKILVMRKTRVSLSEPLRQIWEEEVLGVDHPVLLDQCSAEHRIRYSHPKIGADVVLAGMDIPTRIFSTQYAIIYVNEATELTLNEWERLNRALRGSGMPFRMLLGDCNPAEETHWLNKRCKPARTGEAPKTKRLVGRFYDNPKFYDAERGVWTPEGEEYVERCRTKFSGHRFDQLFRGIWKSAEGAVWPDWDEAVHVLDGQVRKGGAGHQLAIEGWPDSPLDVRFFAGCQDIGFSIENPGCFQLWAFDGFGRMYRVLEIYRHGWDHLDWADAISRVNSRFPIRFLVCDHDPAFVKAINRRLKRVLLPSESFVAREGVKRRGPDNEKVGIDFIRQRLRQAKDGRRRLYFFRDANIEIDEELRQNSKPWRTEEEMPSYKYRTNESDGPNLDSPDDACWDHGIDGMRYLVQYVDDKNLAPSTTTVRQWGQGTYGSFFKNIKDPAWDRFLTHV